MKKNTVPALSDDEFVELEDLLAERLDLLRSGELGPNYAATNRSRKSA